MKKGNQRLQVLGALFALTLAACGGGGGGGAPVSAAPSDSSGGASASGPAVPAAASPGSPNPAASPPVAAGPTDSQAKAFQAFGPTTLATGVQSSIQLPAQPNVVTRLAGGGGVVVWSSGSTLLAQQFGTTGAAAGPQITVNLLFGSARNYWVTALSDGSWVVVWVDYTQAAQGNGRQPVQTLQFKHYSAAGGLLQDTTPAAGPFFGIFPHVQVQGTADGGFAVVWSSNDSLFPPAVAFQRFDGAGAKVGAMVSVAAMAGAQELPHLVALPDNSLEVLWLQSSADNSTRTIAMEHFDASSQPVGPATSIAQSTASGDYDYAAALLGDGRIGVAWHEPLATVPRPLNVSWAISDTAGALQSQGASSSSSSPAATNIEGLDMAPVAAGGFALFAQSSSAGTTATANIGVLLVDSTGAAQGTWATIASRATVEQPASSATPTSGPADTSFSVAGGSDGHYVLSYEAAVTGGAALEILAQ